MENLYNELLQEAKKASNNSYSPYSKFSVGACVLFESNTRYCGANVENASYGLTICAERIAIANAISQGEKTKVKMVAIYSPNQKKCFPCGACRQWLSEFAINEQDTKIILEGDDSLPLVLTLGEIFPHSFKF